MNPFHKKQLSSGKSLAEILRQERLRADLSLETVAETTQISARFIKLLEEGQYHLLPGEVYARQFIKKLASLYHLSAKGLIDIYLKEKDSQMLLLEPATKPAVKFYWTRWLNYQIVRNGIISLVTLLLCGYFGWEIYSIFNPPSLEIVSPLNQLSTSQPYIEIVGQTLPESQVEINNQKILLKPDGSFVELVNLTNGLNTFIITAAKKHSRQNSYTLSILKTTSTTRANTPTVY